MASQQKRDAFGVSGAGDFRSADQLPLPLPEAGPSNDFNLDFPQDFGNMNAAPFGPRPGMPPAPGSIGPGGLPPMRPMLPPPPPPPPHISEPRPEPLHLIKKDIEDISETIIAERWKEVESKLSELKQVKAGYENAMRNMEGRMDGLEKNLNALHTALYGKLEDYGRGVSDVNAELKAMQRVFKDILPALATNVKALSSIVGQAKKSKKSK